MGFPVQTYSERGLRRLTLRWLTIAIVCIILAGTSIALTTRPVGPGTTTGWVTWRTVKTTEDTQLTGSTQKNAPDITADGTVYFQLPVGAVQVAFIGSLAANKTLSWTIWAYKSGSSPAEYVAHGTAVTGATQTGTAGRYYCDTITITDQQWYQPVSVINGAPDAIVSGGGIAKLVFDSCEYQFFTIVIRDIGGGGAEATSAGALISNFN